MSKISRTDTVQGGRVAIPLGLYRVSVNDTESKGPGGKRTYDMTVLKCEILEPETVTIGDQEFSIAGRQFSMFLLHNVAESWGQARVFEMNDKLGLSIPDDDYDTDNHVEYYKGMRFDMILSCEEDFKCRTDEKGKLNRDDPIHDSEGNKISAGYRITANVDGIPDHCNPEKVDMPI